MMAPCGVRDGLIGFKEIVSKRWFDPPWVVLAWLVVWDGEVSHGSFFVSEFLRKLVHSVSQEQVILAVLIIAEFKMICNGLRLRIPISC